MIINLQPDARSLPPKEREAIEEFDKLRKELLGLQADVMEINRKKQEKIRQEKVKLHFTNVNLTEEFQFENRANLQ